MSTRPINIAIDGPAGAGKSTVARMVATRLGEQYTYVDTGALYRGITYQALKNCIDIANEADVVHLANHIKLGFNPQQQLLIDGILTAEEIRTPEVSQNVSRVAAYPGIRQFLLKYLRELADNGGVIMDGRDIGTAVLPNADVKIFLTACIDERAARRASELRSKNYSVDIQTLKKEIALRDQQDSEREVSPLIKADDAILIDTTKLSIEQVVDEIVAICTQTIEAKCK